MTNHKFAKLVLAGAAIGTAAAAYMAYKRQCDAFEAELSEDFDEIEFPDEETTERSYTNISLDKPETQND